MVINKSIVPTKRLERIIKFCKPRGCPEIKMIFKDTVSAYDCGFYYGGYEIPYIIFRFGHHTYFPLSFKLRSDKIKRTGYFGTYEFNNKTEAMIFCISHELKHAQQYAHPLKKFWLYHDLKRAESDADAFAFIKLQKYKKLRNQGINPF